MFSDTSNDRVDARHRLWNISSHPVYCCYRPADHPPPRAGPYLSYRYSIGTNNIQLFSSPSTKLTKPETAILSSVSVWSGAVSQGVAGRARLKATRHHRLMQKCRWQVLCCQWWTRDTWHTWHTWQMLTRQTRDMARRR